MNNNQIKNIKKGNVNIFKILLKVKHSERIKKNIYLITIIMTLFKLSLSSKSQF